MVGRKRLTVFNIANHVFLVLLSLFTLVPFLIVLSGSFTSELGLMKHGVGLLPSEFSTFAYWYIFTQNTGLLSSYAVTILVTAVGTVASLLLTAGIAYTLSVRGLKLRNVLSFYIGFTMLFSGGMIPWYFLCVKYLHLKDTILALIVPMLVSPFNVILMRTSFNQIPESLRESGIIDGAGELRILLRIIIPVSLPIIATVSLFYILSYWNDWYLPLFLIDQRTDLYPLQFHLYRILSTINYINMGKPEVTALFKGIVPTESVRLATTIVTIGPIIFVYPFIQRYFVKGITIGAIKG